MRRFSLSAIGLDRPGIVAAVTEVLYEHDCNIEDSSMTILEDAFAVILITTAPDDAQMDGLLKALKGVEEKMALTINVKEMPAPAPGEGPKNANYIITLHGADRSGIIYKTAKVLANEGVNITDLETKAVGDEDKRLYIMLMEVFCPGGLDVKGLEENLKQLGHELGVTIKIKPVEAFEPL